MSGEAQAVVEALKEFNERDRAHLLIELLAPIAVLNCWQVEVLADLAGSILQFEEQLEKQEMDERVLQ